MGAWGTGNFENDDALDWLGDFSDEPSEELLFEAITEVNEVDEYLESPECSNALASAEIIALLKGFSASNLPEDVKELAEEIEFKPSAGLISESIKAIARIKSDSELKELWEETEHFDQWLSVIEDLEKRLKQVS
jgi:hypothetical protein